jgi:hypothetical protein
MIAPKTRSVHIQLQMIATPGRSSADPPPNLGTEGTEAPEFQVLFSRPAEFAGRPDPRPNSFRWSGSGTIHVMERGLLIIARRRSAMAFHTTEQRFVPAGEICDVYREGNAVRVELRRDLPQRDYFQFWTADAATAGTIVRLLPTTRTIEYEGPSAISVPAPAIASSRRRRPPSARSFTLVALVAGLIGIAAFITADKLRYTARPDNSEHKLPAPATVPSGTAVQGAVPQPKATKATTAQIEAARADLMRYDARIDGLRAQYRMAFAALQSGSLSQADFIEGLDRWLLPQWRALYSEIADTTPADGSLDSLVRKKLMRAVWGWQAALDDYVRGLNDQDSATVLAAFDRMSAANADQSRAWSLIEYAER